MKFVYLFHKPAEECYSSGSDLKDPEQSINKSLKWFIAIIIFCIALNCRAQSESDTLILEDGTAVVLNKWSKDTLYNPIVGYIKQDTIFNYSADSFSFKQTIKEIRTIVCEKRLPFIRRAINYIPQPYLHMRGYLYYDDRGSKIDLRYYITPDGEMIFSN